MKEQPEQLWQKLATFLRATARRLNPISLPSLLIMILEGTGLLLIAWVAMKHFRRLETEQAQLMYCTVTIAGVLTMLYYASKRASGFSQRLRVVLYGQAALATVLALVCNFFDSVVANPTDAVLFLAGGAGIQAVVSICRLARRMNGAQPDIWRYGTTAEKPDEKLSDISTANWLWQQNGIMCTHRMLENLEKALKRAGYELTLVQNADINRLSSPAQMRPHLRQQVEAELLRARELFWAPEQTPEMVGDIIRHSQKSGFARKMLEDLLYDLSKRGWELRALKTDRELENWPLQQVIIRLSAQPGTQLTDLVRCLRRIAGYVRDNSLPPDTKTIPHTGEFPRYESDVLAQT